MSDPVQDLAERGRALSPEERTRLVDLLVASLDDPAAAAVGEAWDREIERRLAAYRAGEVEVFDLEDVLAEARRITT